MTTKTFETKTLVAPLQRGSEQIGAVTLRRPDTGALRGLNLTDVLQMNISAMARLLPRISDPALLPDEIDALHPADLLALSVAVVGFFMTEDQMREEAARLQ